MSNATTPTVDGTVKIQSKSAGRGRGAGLGTRIHEELRATTGSTRSLGQRRDPREAQGNDGDC